MVLTWSIDDVVRTTDEDAVRRRFAQRNRAWLLFLLIVFALASFIAAVNNHSEKTATDVVIAVVNLGIIAFGFFVLRYAAREDLADERFLVQAGAWLRRHTNAVSLIVDHAADDQRVALVCVDVAGHGMASGLVLASLRSGFTLLRDSLLHDPAAVLQRLHTLVSETSRRRMLVTVSAVLLDRTNHTATIASAGNPPVFVRRHADASVETIVLYAPPLGVRLPVEIPQRRIDIAPGDVIVLHSDGIYETRNAADEVYGLDRIEHIIREQGSGNAESLREALLADVAAFRGSVEQHDDVTLVVCRLV